MIGNVASFLTSPALSNIAQSTTSAVTLETTMKAVGRPTFILADKKLDARTKKYATAKEFIYQITCLVTYLFVVVPLFKNGGFKLAKKLMKDESSFKFFDNAKQFLVYKKLAGMSKELRTTELKKEKISKLFSKNIKKELNKETPEAFHILKGTIELGNIIGSVLGLSLFAPQASHIVVRPSLKLLGLENKNQNKTSLNVKV